MRIVYVTETFPPEINGVATTGERALRYLRRVGHDVQLVRPRQPHEGALDNAAEWRTAGCPIPLYPDLRFGLATMQRLRQRFQAFGPALVHAATPGPLAWAALRAARAQGIATSADFRTNFHHYSRHYGLGLIEPWVCEALRRFHTLAGRTFVPTRALADELSARGFERLAVVGRGVEPTEFSPAWRDSVLRGQWQAGEDDRVLLYVGRLAAEKNVALALRTYERLRSREPRLRMVVVGDGPLRRRLQADHPSAIFTGTQRSNDLSRHYASADVFLFPSLTDTFGNVVLEAMASGLAVAAYALGAAGVHVHSGLNGWLTSTLQDDDFTGAASLALSHGAPGGLMRTLARQAALKADWSDVLRQFERELYGVVAETAEGPSRHAALA